MNFCLLRGHDTTYAEQNNGNFTFVVEPFLSLPDDTVNHYLLKEICITLKQILK